jgi:hypothetical protein
MFWSRDQNSCLLGTKVLPMRSKQPFNWYDYFMGIYVIMLFMYFIISFVGFVFVLFLVVFRFSIMLWAVLISWMFWSRDQNSCLLGTKVLPMRSKQPFNWYEWFWSIDKISRLIGANVLVKISKQPCNWCLQNKDISPMLF